MADGTGPVLSFDNAAGSGALLAPNGRWIVYASALDSGFQPGGLPYDFKRHGAADGDWAGDAGNGLVFATPQALLVSGTAATRAYDGTTQATVSQVATSGLLAGDTVDALDITAWTFDDRNAGTLKPVSPQLGSAPTFRDALGLPVYGYAVQGTVLGTITPLVVPVAGLSAADKVYDGTATATLLGQPRVAGLPGDSLFVAPSPPPQALFADAEVGTGKAVTVTGLVLAGADAANYVAAAAICRPAPGCRGRCAPRR